MKTILITRPNYDIPTRYFYYWNKEVIDLAKKQGLEVIDLKVERANHKDFKKEIRKNPFLVILNGQRSEKGISGFRGEVLLECGEEGLFKSKIVCSFLSDSMKKLGMKSIKSGAVAFIGYDDNFVFLCRPKIKTSPLLDETAHPFLDPLRSLAIDLLSRKNPDQSTEKARKAFKAALKRLSERDKFSAPFILWDMNHLKLVKKQRIE